MLLDINAALQTLALELGREHARLAAMTCRRDAHALDEAEPADLVIASYLIGEVGEAERRTLAERLWAKTRDTLLVVEPGTPAGYGRIIELRAQLIAAGAHVAAPCPHDRPMPALRAGLVPLRPAIAAAARAYSDQGAELPFEDEKFSYVVLTRNAPAQTLLPRAGAARGQQSRGVGQAMHGRRRELRESAAPRQGRLCQSPALALG